MQNQELNLLKITLVLIVLLMFTACGKSNDVASNSKPLLSKWSSLTTTDTMDLTNTTLGSSSLIYNLDTGSCACNSDIANDQITLSSCHFNSGHLANCSSLNETFTYSQTNTNLTLCVSGTQNCNEYE